MATRFRIVSYDFNPVTEVLDRTDREVYESQYDYPRRHGPSLDQVAYLMDSFDKVWDKSYIYAAKLCGRNMTKLGYSKDPQARMRRHELDKDSSIYVRALMLPPPYRDNMRYGPAGEAHILHHFGGVPNRSEWRTGLMPNDVIEWAMENDYFVVKATFKEKIA